MLVGAVGALVWSLPVFAEDALLPDSRLGMRIAPMLLLSRPDVQADLKLSPELAAAADHEIRELRSRAGELKGKSDADTISARRQIDDAQQRWLTTNLSAEQRARLHQIDLQWEGPTALVSRPSIANALSLTETQRQGLAEAVTRRDSLRTQGKLRPQDEADLARAAINVLSDQQKSRWKAMMGRPFAVQVAASRTQSRQ
jgi:hypothetical protein